MEARKGIICGLAASGVKPQLKQRQPEQEREQSSGGNDVEEITRTEFRRSQGYLIRIEEPEEDIDPTRTEFLPLMRTLAALNSAFMRRPPQAQEQSSQTKGGRHY
ncbi:hypothetical protein Bca52824_001524 [Brassica carinata]|uniref:Uncharacterized protein n=1 Tax=Brassica carinata TaxID=52824 RepID=A0A8X7WGF7_BRACI|nr:hypothetical protein Bca52824_001524 [Brassica carinata]